MKYACDKCVGDPDLTALIADSWSPGTCSFGHGDQQVIDVAQLAELIDPFYRRYHEAGDWKMIALPDEIGDHDLEQVGDGPDLLLGEAVSCEPELIEAMLDVLEASEARSVIKDGALPMYDRGTIYVFVPPRGGIHHQTWDEFAERIKHRRRFLDPDNRTDLESIFGDETGIEDSPSIAIRKLELGKETAPIVYRARRCTEDEVAWRILKNPNAELGPPPTTSASAGRMNPAGISVFYGSFEKDTAIAEVRPWVGALVVAGGFAVTRPLLLLDLDTVSSGAARLSIFSESFDREYVRAEFLSAFGEIVSRPIGPHESEIEFLPTQVVAEYVSAVLDLDGIVYKSAQNAGEGTNVVIFLDHSNESPMPLQLLPASVETVQVSAIVTTAEIRSDFRIDDLAGLLEWLPRMIRQWNDNQMEFIVAVFHPQLRFEERAERLRRVVENGTIIVTAMRYRVESLDDKSVSLVVDPVVDHYNERLSLVRDMMGAVLTFDKESFAALGTAYHEMSRAENLRSLLEGVFGHARFRPLVETRGFDLPAFINALLATQ